eukprot:scaffold131110_cov36-Phaeocystis_antarctica.AAC.1
MLVQELVAARSDGRVPPTVTYCDLPLSACMVPLPLHTTRRNAWHITIGREMLPNTIRGQPASSAHTVFVLVPLSAQSRAVLFAY